jgi:hypothetical protein
MPTLKNLMLKRHLGVEENVRNETIGMEMECWGASMRVCWEPVCGSGVADDER